MDVLAIDKTGAAPLPGLPSTTPTAALTGFPPDPAQKDETLHKVLAQLVGSNVSVQFQVVAGTHDIITVFKNKDTGEVISQFPPEAMVLIAQFFNKLAGAVLDRTA